MAHDSSWLNTAWSELSDIPAAGSVGWKTRQVHADSSYELYIGVRHPGSERALLFEVDAEDITPVVEYPQSRGFQVWPETIKAGPHGRVRLCLALTENGYRDVFSVLVSDVTRSLADSKSGKDAVRSFFGRLNIWQLFFKRHSDGLSDSEQKGLFGELHVLRTTISKIAPVHLALRSWQGPARSARDFVFSNGAAEVKTTMTGSRSFSISSLEQLDSDEAGELHLVLVSLRKSQSGTTLKEMVQDVSDMLSAESRHLLPDFNDKLLQYGYVHEAANRYDKVKYDVASTAIFHVRPEFPSLTRSNVPAAVESASYAIRIEECIPWEIEEDTFLSNMHM